jgi:hypothetical protein
MMRKGHPVFEGIDRAFEFGVVMGLEASLTMSPAEITEKIKQLKSELADREVPV